MTRFSVGPALLACFLCSLSVDANFHGVSDIGLLRKQLRRRARKWGNVNQYAPPPPPPTPYPAPMGGSNVNDDDDQGGRLTTHIKNSRAAALEQYGLGSSLEHANHRNTPAPISLPTPAPTITNDKRYLWQLDKCKIKEYVFARPMYCKKYAKCTCCDNLKTCKGGCTDKHFLNFDPQADYDDKTCSNNPDFIAKVSDQEADDDSEYKASSHENDPGIIDSKLKPVQCGLCIHRDMMWCNLDNKCYNPAISGDVDYSPCKRKKHMCAAKNGKIGCSCVSCDDSECKPATAMGMGICEVSVWTSWTKCNVPCGDGKKVRYRRIERNRGAADCPTNLRELRSCALPMCAKDVAEQKALIRSGRAHYGCTHGMASNFDPAANVDNGSCKDTVEAGERVLHGGCLDKKAQNFDPSANYDNKSCRYKHMTEEQIHDALGAGGPGFVVGIHESKHNVETGMQRHAGSDFDDDANYNSELEGLVHQGKSWEQAAHILEIQERKKKEEEYNKLLKNLVDEGMDKHEAMEVLKDKKYFHPTANCGDDNFLAKRCPHCRCKIWAKIGETHSLAERPISWCKSKPHFMLKHCPFECGMCPRPSPDCMVDLKQHCIGQFRHGSRCEECVSKRQQKLTESPCIYADPDFYCKRS